MSSRVTTPRYRSRASTTGIAFTPYVVMLRSASDSAASALIDFTGFVITSLATTVGRRRSVSH